MNKRLRDLRRVMGLNQFQLQLPLVVDSEDAGDRDPNSSVGPDILQAEKQTLRGDIKM